MKLTSQPTTRQPRLVLERGAADNIPPAVDPALRRAVLAWRKARAELALGRLLDEPWRGVA